MKTTLTVKLLAVALVATGSVGLSAELLVPSQYATIGAAITAAQNGDTVIIEDSNIYVDDVFLNKPITVQAAAGETPTVRPTGDNSYALLFGADANGAQFGSNDGGTITIDFSQGLGAVNRGIYHNYNTGVTTIENVVIEGAPSGTALAMQILYPVFATSGTSDAEAILRNVTIDGTNVQWIARLTFMAGATLTLEDVVIDSDPGLADQMAFHATGAGSTGTVNISNSVVRGGNIALYTNTNAGAINWNVENSYISNITTGATPPSSRQAVSMRSGGHVLTFTDSVVENTWEIGHVVYLWTGAPDVEVYLDHCDVLSPDIGIFGQVDTGRVVDVKNTNFVVANQAVWLTPTAGDTTSLDWNNYVSPNENYILPNEGGSALDPGENSLFGEDAVEPTYASPGAPDYNYGYDNTELLTASSTGTPIGSFLNGEVTNVRTWMEFH